MLILASNSPRRRQLLALCGWDFRILSAPVDESPLPGELPGAYVLRLAESKARAAAALLTSQSPETLLIAADTAVINGQGQALDILGKPQDFDEAERMLRGLRGRMHRVHTAVAVLRLRDQRLSSSVCVTDVQMRDYTDLEMAAYIASGDPLDKAGAYAIQHTTFKPVERLQGCYANVMGLPVCLLARLLAEFGVVPKTDVLQACQELLGEPCQVYRQALQADSPTPGDFSAGGISTGIDLP